MKYFVSRSLLLALAGLVALLFTGCAQTEMVKSSKAKGAGPIQFQKIFILALAQDDFNRRLAEVKLKEEVTSVATVGGYEFFPDINDLKNKQKVFQGIKDSGADGLVVLRLTAKTEEVTTNATNLRPMDLQVFSDYWTTVYDPSLYFATDPRALGLDTIFVIETRIFDAKSGKLIWTGETKSTKGVTKDHDVRGLMGEVASAVRSELRSEGLIH